MAAVGGARGVRRIRRFFFFAAVAPLRGPDSEVPGNPSSASVPCFASYAVPRLPRLARAGVFRPAGLSRRCPDLPPHPAAHDAWRRERAAVRSGRRYTGRATRRRSWSRKETRIYLYHWTEGGGGRLIGRFDEAGIARISDNGRAIVFTRSNVIWRWTVEGGVRRTGPCGERKQASSHGPRHSRLGRRKPSGLRPEQREPTRRLLQP